MSGPDFPFPALRRAAGLLVAAHMLSACIFTFGGSPEETLTTTHTSPPPLTAHSEATPEARRGAHPGADRGAHPGGTGGAGETALDPDEYPLVASYKSDRAPYGQADLTPKWRPPAESREAGIWMQVDKLEKVSRTSGARMTDPALQAYLDGLVCRLAGPYCGDIRVYLVRAPAFNASMFPNGMMTVFTGLLLRAQNEAQLAMVIGHEIGHYLQRHSLKRLEDAYVKADMATWISVLSAGAGVGSLGVGTLIAIATDASIAHFSRDQEREADQFGAILMDLEGYDLNEAPKIWRQLIAERDADEDELWRNPFFASHPGPGERAAALGTFAAALQAKSRNTKTNEAAYWRLIEPHRGRFLADELAHRNAGPTLSLINSLFAGGRGLGELHFFEGEVYRLRADPEEHDLEAALVSYQAALRAPDPPVEVYRSLGLVHEKLGNGAEARDAFLTYLKKSPDASDAPIIQMMLDPKLG